MLSNLLVQIVEHKTLLVLDQTNRIYSYVQRRNDMQKTVKYTDYLAITLLTLVACVWLFLTPEYPTKLAVTVPDARK